MSVFNPLNWFSPWGRPIAQIDTHAAVAPEEPVKPADPIDRQNMIVTATGDVPGFDDAPPLTIPIVTRMRKFGTIQFAYTVTISPILSGKQAIRIINKRADQVLAARMKEAAEEDFLPGVTEWLPGMMEALHYGNLIQEPQWDTRDGRTVPIAFHPVPPGQATIFRDKFNRFTGYQIGETYRDARYALLSVNTPHIDPIFGESRNAFCREEWWRIIQGEIQADKMERKAAGIQMAVGVPMGDSFTDDAGKQIFPKDLVQNIANACAQGKIILYPKYAFKQSQIFAKPELAEMSPVTIQAFDWGNIGPSMMAHLARKAVGAIDIMRAWHRPEREAMQGTSGTNAESETQGAIGTTDSEAVAYQAMRQFTKQILDRWAVTNFGPDAAGIIAIEQAPLSDPQQAFLQKMTLALATNTVTGPSITSSTDERGLLERVEMPILSEEDAAAKKAEMDQQAADKATQQAKDMQGNDPQNGKPNGAPGKLAIAASENGHRSRVEQLFQDALRDG